MERLYSYRLHPVSSGWHFRTTHQTIWHRYLPPKHKYELWTVEWVSSIPGIPVNVVQWFQVCSQVPGRLRLTQLVSWLLLRFLRKHETYDNECTTLPCGFTTGRTRFVRDHLSDTALILFRSCRSSQIWGYRWQVIYKYGFLGGQYSECSCRDIYRLIQLISTMVVDLYQNRYSIKGLSLLWCSRNCQICRLRLHTLSSGQQGYCDGPKSYLEGSEAMSFQLKKQ